MKRVQYPATIVCALAIATGCSRSQQEFPRRSGPADRFTIKLEALRYVFDETIALGGNNAAGGDRCFIVEDATDAERLVQSFSEFRFPVAGSDQLKEEGDYFVDRSTGAPATIWSVEIKSMEAGRAVAYVKWYASPDAAGGYTLNLLYDGVKWSVTSMTEDWIS